MAIKSVKVKINDTWTNLTLNASTGKWEGTVTAPPLTSYNMNGGYYPVAIEAANDAGTVSTTTAADPVVGNSLRLFVKELVKPVITLVTPSNGALTTNNKQPITFRVTDEVNGSGVDTATVTLQVGNNTYTQSSAGMVKSSITNGWQFVYTPQGVLIDGSHTIKINAADHDGNKATQVTASFTVDTTKPTLTVSEPADGLITNKPDQIIRGLTNDNLTSPVTVTAKLGNTSLGNISVESDGTFAAAVTFAEGDNVLTVRSTDAAGLYTELTIRVKLDTTVPQVRGVEIGPNPANASASVRISLEVV